MKKTLIGFIITIVLVSAGAFYGGMRYQQSKTPARPGFAAGQFGTNGTQRIGNGAPNGGFATGQIISADSQSITIKMQDGGSKIVFLSGSTEVGKTVTGTASDLAVGTNVVASGTANSDGSVTAATIQIRPVGQVPPQTPGQ